MELGINEIKKILPHRYPFLLIDKIVEIEEGKRAVGIKNVTGNEEFFQGHFPDYPVMPGVLIIEAMAQTGGVAILSMPEYKGKIAFFAGIKEAKFKRQVFPGDVLKFEVEIEKMRRGFGVGKATATVQEEIVAMCGLIFAIER